MPYDARDLTKYYDRLIRYLVGGFRFTPDDARDLAQDIFVSVLKHMTKESSEPIEELWSFLKRTAHNRAINEIRRRRIRWTVHGRDPIESLEETEEDFWTRRKPPSPEDLAKWSEELKRLGHEVDNLSPSLRQPLLLKLSGLSYEEIATALDISEDAVRTRLRDARRILKDRLGPRGG